MQFYSFIEIERKCSFLFVDERGEDHHDNVLGRTPMDTASHPRENEMQGEQKIVWHQRLKQAEGRRESSR